MTVLATRLLLLAVYVITGMFVVAAVVIVAVALGCSVWTLTQVMLDETSR